MNKLNDFITIFVTAVSMDEAETISVALLEERLIACANIVPEIVSHYRWKGKLCRDNEVLIVMKSRKERLEAIIEKVKTLHSYDVPEIISLPIIGGSREYLHWLSDST